MTKDDALSKLEAKAAECRNLATMARDPGVAQLLVQMAEKYQKQAERKMAGPKPE